MDFNSLALRLQWFENHKLKQGFNKIEAVVAIQLYAQLGKPIPEELHSMLTEICDSWGKSNKVLYSKKATADKYHSYAWDVAALMKQGATREEAYKLVAERHCTTFDNVRKHYEGTKNKSAKDEVDMLFGSYDSM